jgi:hypothetical protein
MSTSIQDHLGQQQFNGDQIRAVSPEELSRGRLEPNSDLQNTMSNTSFYNFASSDSRLDLRNPEHCREKVRELATGRRAKWKLHFKRRKWIYLALFVIFLAILLPVL